MQMMSHIEDFIGGVEGSRHLATCSQIYVGCLCIALDPFESCGCREISFPYTSLSAFYDHSS